jgi:hypothetical protein
MDHLSEHCKEVYAHFGLAMYRAQCVEQSIIQLLIFADFFPTNLPKYKTTEQWEKDFDKYDELLSSKTMGQLLKYLNNLSAVDSTIEALLKKALNQRNWLAHSFFVDHALSFLSSNGRDKMIQELEESRELFNIVENILSPIKHSLFEKYGLTQEKCQEMERDLFRDANGDI